MSSGSGGEPPSVIEYSLDEALDLLADLEDARDSLTGTGHLAAVIVVEGQIRVLSRKLGFADPQGVDDAR
jgi:hypothetical protein